MEERAYTTLGPGTAQLGNRWIARSWSAFMGQTIGIEQAAGPTEWLAGKAPEFAVETDTAAFGVMELGDVEWSEERSEWGAGLVMCKSSPEGLGVVVGNLAFHEAPVLVRTVRVFNAGTTPLQVHAVRADVLPLAAADAVVYANALTEEHPSAVADAASGPVAVAAGGRGLVFGIEGRGRIDVFHGRPGECAFVFAGPRTIPQGRHWDLAPMYMIPFAGGMGDHVHKLIARYRKQRDAMRAWEAQCRRQQREETRRN